MLTGAKITPFLSYRATKNLLIPGGDLGCRGVVERVAAGTIQHANQAILVVCLHYSAEHEVMLQAFRCGIQLFFCFIYNPTVIYFSSKTCLILYPEICG